MPGREPHTKGACVKVFTLIVSVSHLGCWQASPYVFGVSLPNTMLLDGLIPVLQRNGITQVSMVYSVNDPYTV
jgi:hypothetical protein